ncbi:F-box only protein 33-like [Prorops nasuta]|uniref:F-box only protein 33-like n=1 Tax=Prorops nasuta TaxID=863751 RepID=UPI0034CFAA2A
MRKICYLANSVQLDPVNGEVKQLFELWRSLDYSDMAQEDINPCWDNLPSVILQEIFSYLPHETRIEASQVCKNWRYALFHPSFWKKITFALEDEDRILWARFLADCFGLSVQEVTIRCEMPMYALNETSILLKKLSNNRQLRKLFLESSESTFERSVTDMEMDEDSQTTNSKPLITHIVKIIETSNCLEALSLGCIEELTASASIILEPLSLHHAKHLTHLSLASVKDDPDHYDFLELDHNMFRSFGRLTILTIDYDFVSDKFLNALDTGIMERLVIHVHGWNNDYPGTTNDAWQSFTQKNPHCQLRLNLIHSYVGIKVLDTDILRPDMPLTHLKVLFCETVNNRALHHLSNWYQDTLQSFIWMDSMNHLQKIPATYDPNDPDSPDPLVIVAWKCTKLRELVFIGHKYYQQNLLAIARLRGSKLNYLAFAEDNIVSDYELWHKTDSSIIHEIQQIMGDRWESLSDAELPPVVMDPFGNDSREVIIPMVLRDQK